MAMTSTYSEDAKEDQLTRAIKRNPCGICRNRRLPVCKCGRGAGGGDEDSNSSRDAANASTSTKVYTAATQPLISTTPSIYVSAAKDWSEFTNKDDVTEPSSIDTADEPILLDDETILLDPVQQPTLTSDQINQMAEFKVDEDCQTLIISPRKGLSDDENDALPQLFRALKLELDGFKQKLEACGIRLENSDIQIQNNRNQLIIHVSIPYVFQMLIERLIDRNLLPTPPSYTHSAMTPSLFSMQPSLSSSARKSDDDEKDNEKREATETKNDKSDNGVDVSEIKNDAGATVTQTSSPFNLSHILSSPKLIMGTK